MWVMILDLIAQLHTYNNFAFLYYASCKRSIYEILLFHTRMKVVSGSSQALGTAGLKPDSMQGHADAE